MECPKAKLTIVYNLDKQLRALSYEKSKKRRNVFMHMCRFQQILNLIQERIPSYYCPGIPERIFRNSLKSEEQWLQRQVWNAIDNNWSNEELRKHIRHFIHETLPDVYNLFPEDGFPTYNPDIKKDPDEE